MPFQTGAPAMIASYSANSLGVGHSTVRSMSFTVASGAVSSMPSTIDFAMLKVKFAPRSPHSLGSLPQHGVLEPGVATTAIAAFDLPDACTCRRNSLVDCIAESVSSSPSLEHSAAAREDAN